MPKNAGISFSILRRLRFKQCKWTRFYKIDQDPVVQKVDNTVFWINLYPVNRANLWWFIQQTALFNVWTPVAMAAGTSLLFIALTYDQTFTCSGVQTLWDENQISANDAVVIPLKMFDQRYF